MPYINPILKHLGGKILYRKITDPYLASDSSILLAPVSLPLAEHTVLIGTYKTLCDQFAQTTPLPHTTAIVTKADGHPDPARMKFQTDNLVFTEADTLQAYAHFLSCFHQYHVWRYRLNSAFTYADSRTFLPALSQTVQCAVYIYSASGHILMDYSTKAFHNDYTESLKTCRTLPEEIQAHLREETPEMPLYLTLSNGYSCLLYSMTDAMGYSILLLLLYQGKLSIAIPPDDFLLIIAGQWEKHLDFQQSFHKLPPPTACDKLLEALYENSITDPYLIGEMIGRLDNPLQRYVGFLYIAFPKAENPALYLRSLKEELRLFFPGHNIGYCQDALVVILSCEENFFSTAMPEDGKAFDTWLREKNAYAGSSMATQYWEKLHTQLRFAQSICHLGLFLFADRERRLFDCIRLQTYQIIDLCAKAFLEEYGHDDLIYLTHPALIQLSRYDKANGTNLRHTLFCYLLSGCNVNQAADILYMHRNTVRNQLHRILELTHVDLDDGYLRLNLLLSCQMIRYYEKVLGHHLKL